MMYRTKPCWTFTGGISPQSRALTSAIIHMTGWLTAAGSAIHQLWILKKTFPVSWSDKSIPSIFNFSDRQRWRLPQVKAALHRCQHFLKIGISWEHSSDLWGWRELTPSQMRSGDFPRPCQRQTNFCLLLPDWACPRTKVAFPNPKTWKLDGGRGTANQSRNGQAMVMVTIRNLCQRTSAEPSKLGTNCIHLLFLFSCLSVVLMPVGLYIVVRRNIYALDGSRGLAHSAY